MSKNPENAAPQKDPKTGRFLPGNSGFGGKPKGARNKLGEAFIKALEEDFQEHGVEAIETVRAEKPDQYLKVIASLMPKELNLNVNEAESLTDEQIIERLRKLNEILGPVIGASGNGIAGERVIAPTTH